MYGIYYINYRILLQAFFVNFACRLLYGFAKMLNFGSAYTHEKLVTISRFGCNYRLYIETCAHAVLRYCCVDSYFIVKNEAAC